MRTRIFFVAMGILALLAAMWAGLVRLGWNLPPLLQTLPQAHGPLMVAGFVGTLVSLERAVALGKPWTYAAPAFSALGALTLLIDLPIPLGKGLILLGSLALVAVFFLIVRRQPALFTFTMMLGAGMWFVGNFLWLAGRSTSEIVLWWAGYLILTIAGERLELGRLHRLSKNVEGLFLGLIIVFTLGLVLTTIRLDLGTRVSGLALLGLGLWLLRYDIARQTIRQAGLTRFIAASLLVGYVWLGVGGLFALGFDRPFQSAVQYDALLHTLFLGCIMSMIFGHAPIIFPAVLGRPLSYSSAFYAHLALLHLSLLLRVGGDLFNVPLAREWGGMLNVIAVLLFLANTGRAIREGSRGTSRLQNLAAPLA